MRSHDFAPTRYVADIQHLLRYSDIATVKQVNYPKHSPTRQYYEKCRTPNGGYGGLLSATFYTKQDAITFFDKLDTVKGPSLGTNFTLRSVYSCMTSHLARSSPNHLLESALANT